MFLCVIGLDVYVYDVFLFCVSDVVSCSLMCLCVWCCLVVAFGYIDVSVGVVMCA